MTHVKNAEAFAKLVDYCTGYGGTYNPGRPTLRIESLISQLQHANEALSLVIVAKSQYDNEVNQRKQAFDKLPRVISSILRTLEASGVSKEKLDDARAFAQLALGASPKRKVVALKKGATETPDVVPPKPALQLAYVSKVDAFKKLIQAASTEPLYQPNEVELSVATLSALAAALEQLNGRVSAARVVWSNALINRNNVLYKQAQSMKATGRAVKRYVRAVFGHDSEQYAQLKALTFVKPNNV
jgi:hypothetical protein